MFTYQRVKSARTPSAKQKKQTRPNRPSKYQAKIATERTILIIASITTMVATLAIDLSLISTISSTLMTRPAKILTKILTTTMVIVSPKRQILL